VTPTVWPGAPYPLGATYDGSGTTFSLYTEVADRVELCLFDDDGTETRVELPEVTAFCHHGHLPGIGPGQRYGYRVHGPWDPPAGHRCNPAKLLLDPYSKAVEGEVADGDLIYDHRQGSTDEPDDRDSAPAMPRSVVINPYFDWGDDRPPRIELHRTVIYETHVRGLTIRHPDVPPELRGTYAGMAHPAVVDHLVQLGVTAVELLPVHHFVPERELVERGLTNYWGYCSLAYLAPHGPYSASGQRGQQVQEFKTLVRSLHQADIEVILDVVYNHTGEGGANGPTYAFRGIDNATYYRLDGSDRRRYVDYTGTGNSLNVRHPQVLKLIMDSLRYWILEMHVDGFRFDLASALARELHDVDRLAAFFDLIHQDPVVSQVKLIAEPWDVGDGGYQVGNFPILWSEWNGRYRDGVRDCWRGAYEAVADLASRFTGSSDLYEWTGRRPVASINFLTAHDGFTLADLVTYEHKRNEANGEDNRDGEDHNRSWNSGVEGPTDDPAILDIRARRRRSMLATLLLSQGVPMLLGGDELGRSQGGNNNAYCQDNEISWYDWETVDEGLLAVTRRLIGFRAAHPVFRRRRWFQGRPERGSGLDDIGWYTPAGEQMSDEDWRVGQATSLAVFLNGQAIPSPGPRGERIVDDSFLVLFNARADPLDFVVPDGLGGSRWEVVLDTAEPEGHERVVVAADEWTVSSWSLVVLQRMDGEP
jgi:glycogen operon protein